MQAGAGAVVFGDFAVCVFGGGEPWRRWFGALAGCGWLAWGCRGLILHEAPRIVDIRDRRWQYSVIVFCASETELQSVAPVVSAAGAIYFSASADHIREKSGGERALELERNPGVRLVAPAAMIMPVVGGVQIYSLFHGNYSGGWACRNVRTSAPIKLTGA